MSAKRTTFPPRSRGRRKADQIANRIRDTIKLIMMLAGAVFFAYKAGIGMYIEHVITWQAVDKIKQNQAR